MSLPGLGRALTAALAAAALALTLAAAAPASAAPGDDPRAVPPTRDARVALERADAILAGAGDPGPARRVDASLALRDVFVARPTMGFFESWRAERLLARPTDGRGDLFGDGYRAPATKRCGGHFCIHYVTRTVDAPPSRGWVERTLRTMQRVRDVEVRRLGYRPPPTDRRRGGNAKFDVYLKDLGSQGLYGYCAPERRVRGTRKVASSFCVLDNDFARKQYHAPPGVSLQVTAAHEFFHAIQFGYDFKEDPWLLESTATWMEDQVVDGANDNRRYLPFGQVQRPGTSLDTFDPSGLNQYGNWAFWQYLSERHGPGIVRKVWARADARPGRPDMYSVEALRAVLARRGGLGPTFAAYAAGNTVPARTYAEGASWPAAAGHHRGWRLGPASGPVRTSTRINHLASRNLAFRPARSLRGGRWRLRVNVDGPDRVTGPAVHVIVRRRDGSVTRRHVALNRRGYGTVDVRFSTREVRLVTVTLANASTRFRCGKGGEFFACNGKPADQGRRFAVRARVLRR